MKRKKNPEYRLDLSVCVDRSLFTGDALDVLGRVLAQLEAWNAGLHVWQDDETGRRELVGGLAESLRQIALERGDLFRQLVARYGRPPSERRHGSIELRGGDDSLIVIVRLDDYVFAPSSGVYIWGNTVSFQFCRWECCGETAPVLARKVAEACCREINVLYARGHLMEEREAKNLSTEGGGAMAIGVDMSRYLPGLYWLNYFGKPYCDLIGRERLLGAPAFESSAVGDGVLIQVDEKPESWSTDESHYSKVLSHIGDEYFFLRDKKNRKTRAPDFGLKELPRFDRFT